MKKTLGLLVIAGGLFAVSNANATLFDPYIGGAIQFNKAKAYGDPSDVSFNKIKGAYSGFIGFNLPIIRAEVEYNYFQVKEKNSEALDQHNVMANAYLKPFAIPFVKPYIGAGVGMNFAGDIDNSAAAQAMLGVSLDLPAMPLAFDLEYRATYSFDVFENGDYDLLSYGPRAKFRYSF